MQTPATQTRDWRALAGTGIAACVSGFLWLQRNHHGAALLCVLACTGFLLALCLPRAWKPVQSFIDRLTALLLRALSWLLLWLVFVLIFIPGRLVLLLRRKDPLSRAAEPGRDSYWEPLPARHPGKSHHHQY